MTAVSSVADVDAWIAQLSDCKQLPESEIKKLCEKVHIYSCITLLSSNKNFGCLATTK
jgi:hypothetical protein